MLVKPDPYVIARVDGAGPYDHVAVLGRTSTVWAGGSNPVWQGPTGQLEPWQWKRVVLSRPSSRRPSAATARRSAKAATAATAATTATTATSPMSGPALLLQSSTACIEVSSAASGCPTAAQNGGQTTSAHLRRTWPLCDACLTAPSCAAAVRLEVWDDAHVGKPTLLGSASLPIDVLATIRAARRPPGQYVHVQLRAPRDEGARSPVGSPRCIAIL